jgi:iron complex transport system substrate-binding protein
VGLSSSWNRWHGGGLLLAAALLSCTGAPPPARAVATTSAERIVVVAPAAAEMLEALGALELVVGIGDFVSEPASIAGLPRVGAYDSPNVEIVLSLGADLLVTVASEAGTPAHGRLEALGVPVLALDTATYDGVFAALAELGAAIGRDEEASALAQRIREELRTIAERVEKLERRSVLFVVGRNPVYVAGPGSHVDEMITLAGGTNVVHDALSPYLRVSMEAILERAPDVIIDTSDNRPDAPLGRHAGDWARWEFLPAVREERVYRVAPSRLVIPGIRLPEMTRLMSRLIHPEVFGETTEADLRPR